MPQVVGPGGDDSYAEEQADASANYSTAVHQRGPGKGGPYPTSTGGSPGGSGRSPGPARTRAVTHTAAPPGIFDDYSGPQVDAAKTVIKTYMGFLGWPQSVDTEQMALDILKGGLENKPQDAFEHLWNSKFLTDDMRKANPWARFGQDADTFHQNLAATQDTIKRMTGMDVSLGDMLPGLGAGGAPQAPGGEIGLRQGPHGSPMEGGPIPDFSPRARGISGPDPMSLLLENAMKHGWTQQQIMDSLQAGSFTSLEGEKVDLTGVTAAEPWLLAGQSYQQQAQQFHTIYGAAPVDTAQLAGWFRFNQSAAQIGPWYARQAMTQAPSKLPTANVQTEVR